MNALRLKGIFVCGESKSNLVKTTAFLKVLYEVERLKIQHPCFLLVFVYVCVNHMFN